MNSYLAAEGFDPNITSSQLNNGKFENTVPVPPNTAGQFFRVLKRYFTEKKVDPVPAIDLPTLSVTRGQLDNLSNNQLHVVKLGHSSILLKVYGEYWLLDPVFAKRASPFSFMGPKRFHPSPISISELPPIDKVLISHNHYDHLDKSAIQQLVDKTSEFLVPLGVENDLQKWGVATDKVRSFDWWQELNTKSALIAFTPTRHFSGRGLSDSNSTLWGSWVIKTNRESLYFSGDSGYFDGFKQIGDRYGPFDLTMIETGAYDDNWPDIHMTPEQSIQAHMDLGGKVMMPIHNGTFDLAFHSWYEPLERIANLAKGAKQNLLTPVAGEITAMGALPESDYWWRNYM